LSLGAELVYADARVKVLLLDHDDADAAKLKSALEPLAHRATIASSLDDAAGSDAGASEAVVIGTRGALGDRTERCRQLRAGGYLGAVVAVCVEVAEGEGFLDAGADDFVTVPYDAREIDARLRASVRRVAARSRLRWDSMELDQVGRTLSLGDQSIALTNRECALLACLMRAGGTVVSRGTLRERIWLRKEDRGTNLVEVHLSRLREKLGEHASMIETVRRAGYRLRR
jgi:DNA-binding response OmpR family regulator